MCGMVAEGGDQVRGRFSRQSPQARSRWIPGGTGIKAEKGLKKTEIINPRIEVVLNEEEVGNELRDG